MFGYDVDFDEFIRDTANSFKPTNNYIFNQQVLLELYLSKFDISNQSTLSSAFGLTRLNGAEDTFKDTLYDGYLFTYLHHDVGKKLNLSFDEFINRPRYQIQSMLNAIKEIDRKRMAADSAIMSEIQGTQKGNKQ